ncbi:hypothetical protein B0H14DRAFT_3153720 [Mycena olivaceomarginata]|nr:hypothetical protein B0H14DRAFT_3153720 [Mycena olivaceomarginata]
MPGRNKRSHKFRLNHLLTVGGWTQKHNGACVCRGSGCDVHPTTRLKEPEEQRVLVFQDFVGALDVTSIPRLFSPVRGLVSVGALDVPSIPRLFSLSNALGTISPAGDQGAPKEHATGVERSAGVAWPQGIVHDADDDGNASEQARVDGRSCADLKHATFGGPQRMKHARTDAVWPARAGAPRGEAPETQGGGLRTRSSWDKFRELCLGDFDTFAAVASIYDLVFGGADLTVEGAGFVSISSTPRSTAEWTPRRVFENNEDERTYMDRMTQLDGMTAVFPNPTTSWAARFKSNVITDLDTIAREITNSERPITRLLRSADEYTENVVLKREASARSQHRHFFDGPSQVPAARIAQMIEENKGTGPKWLLQELNPVLRKCGELRAFVVLKQVIGGGGYNANRRREAMEKNGYGLKVMRRVGGTRVRRDHARQQFEAFTLATLAALIQKDEQRYARESDLAYLARLDVTYFEKRWCLVVLRQRGGTPAYGLVLAYGRR